MTSQPPSYHGYRFPAEIISHAEVSRQPTRQREGQMRGFKSAAHAQRFLPVHGLVQNLFRVGRHLLRAVHHRLLRMAPSSCGVRSRTCVRQLDSAR